MCFSSKYQVDLNMHANRTKKKKINSNCLFYLLLALKYVVRTLYVVHMCGIIWNWIEKKDWRNCTTLTIYHLYSPWSQWNLTKTKRRNKNDKKLKKKCSTNFLRIFNFFVDTMCTLAHILFVYFIHKTTHANHFINNFFLFFSNISDTQASGSESFLWSCLRLKYNM